MKTMPVSEFKAKCLRLMEEVRRTGEPIEITKRGKTIVVVSPPPSEKIDWTPGAFKDEIRIVGDIEVDLADLGVQWEAMR